MNVNDPHRSASPTSAAAARARSEDSSATASDLDLAELVRSLCALAADSPERQAKIQNLLHAYAAGNLELNAEATACAMIDDAYRVRRTRR